MAEFKVFDEGVYYHIGDDNTYIDRLIITREAFVEAFNKYIGEDIQRRLSEISDDGK